MTLDITMVAGEEFITKVLDGTLTDLGTATIDVGLYLDATDALVDGDTDPATAITTEPATANYPSYARATVNLSAVQVTAGSVWGLDNDASFSFTLDGTASNNVDGVFAVTSFNSAEGGSTGDWLLFNAALSQTRDAGSVDSIDFAAGDLRWDFE